MVIPSHLETEIEGPTVTPCHLEAQTEGSLVIPCHFEIQTEGSLLLLLLLQQLLLPKRNIRQCDGFQRFSAHPQSLPSPGARPS